MKSTNAVLEAKETAYATPDGIDTRVAISLKCDLVLEDWELFKESQAFMNEQMDIEEDEADHMLALITWAIHQAYEARTGKPFVLRMDRPKN